MGSPATSNVPRARGTMALSTKALGTRSVIDKFRVSGSFKAAFPRRTDTVEAIMVNTSGGLTGGDRFDVTGTVGTGSTMTLTTQAAERAYKSTTGAANVRTTLTVEDAARLHWLPQELIVFDHASLDRRLSIDLAPTAELVLVEPLVFGRAAMGETVTHCDFRDEIVLHRAGTPLFADRTHWTGNAAAHLDRPGLGRGARAAALALYAGPRAEALAGRLTDTLPDTAAASLIAPDLLVLRMLAPDGFLLRRHLIPALEALTNTPLPRSWSL